MNLKDLFSYHLPEKIIFKDNENIFCSFHIFLSFQGKEGAFMVRNSSQVGMYTVSLFSKAVR